MPSRKRTDRGCKAKRINRGLQSILRSVEIFLESGQVVLVSISSRNQNFICRGGWFVVIQPGRETSITPKMIPFWCSGKWTKSHWLTIRSKPITELSTSCAQNLVHHCYNAWVQNLLPWIEAFLLIRQKFVAYAIRSTICWEISLVFRNAQVASLYWHGKERCATIIVD